MTSDSTTLPNGFGLAVAIVASALQAWVGRRVGLRPRTSYWLAALVLAMCLLTGNDTLSDVWRTMGLERLCSWINAVLFLWCLCIIAATFLLILGSVVKGGSAAGTEAEAACQC